MTDMRSPKPFADGSSLIVFDQEGDAEYEKVGEDFLGFKFAWPFEKTKGHKKCFRKYKGGPRSKWENFILRNVEF